ncbi:hypothetical protein C1H46_041384 [Malus baccata]|uniref:Wbp11/ELF5/Saf1 N-terminal domain-containing protein n=1 Tax=Malus baccata TaxID=106549 RepID=A0A540KGH3_MALBA|nr:hypothetical protein C1H46_041384 [Malus baccata]
MKTTKGGKVMNPTDVYRKELRKKALKRNKKERKKVREVGILKKDPETPKEQIDKLEMMKANGALDKARKHKKRQLEDTLNLVIKKQKDSVYYHPTLNPTGAPPLGKPPMFKSSMGPRIPLSAASSSGAASSSKMESEDAVPLAESGNNGPGDGSVIPARKWSRFLITLNFPLLHLFNCPPSLLLLASEEMRRNKINLHCLILTSKDSTQVHTMLPPPPPGLLPKSTNNQSGGATSDAETNNVQLTKDFINMVPPPPPPPPRQQPPVPGPTQGISRFPPPPPPPDMRPPLSTPGLPT